MSAADLAWWAMVLGAVGLMALVTVVGIGLRVVTRHPATYDPARNAARYTYPAAIFALIGVVALVAALVLIILAALRAIP